ncbi:hypothetical protein EMA8858_01614 [Emticicia aquatica]|uniref:Uncharacterized protein n=1 Tax=Emticicia aquatica TaxID=1681835 RepID=A0ABN8ERG7_9BACT|nr:hypothetical protein [Emticicia aquatica]CAH0995491.1 hypothetical protein EMA8858_01614 [Emticicia aquatica]
MILIIITSDLNHVFDWGLKVILQHEIILHRALAICILLVND